MMKCNKDKWSCVLIKTENSTTGLERLFFGMICIKINIDLVRSVHIYFTEMELLGPINQIW